MYNNIMKFPDIDRFPIYKKTRESQPVFENQDRIPTIIDNVFSNDQINIIIDAMNAHPKSQTRIQEWGGQALFDHLKVPDTIYSALQTAANNNFNEDLDIVFVSFARYASEYGYKLKLFPHFDQDKFTNHTMILDVQLKSNENWDLIIEGVNFPLKDNQGILFSATEQIHWREMKDLSKNSEINMVFCWLKPKNSRPITEEFKKLMSIRAERIREETGIFSDTQTI